MIHFYATLLQQVTSVQLIDNIINNYNDFIIHSLSSTLASCCFGPCSITPPKSDSHRLKDAREIPLRGFLIPKLYNLSLERIKHYKPDL